LKYHGRGDHRDHQRHIQRNLPQHLELGSGTDGGTGSDGSDGGAANTPVIKGLSPNQMNRAINRGQGPSRITRIDTLKIPYEKLHATFEDGSALKVDKTWKHGGLVLTHDQSSWLVENGWKLP
jgi:hypothetical protein